jgi:adenosine deaminase
MNGTDGRDLAALPKDHLHLHMEAAMRPGTLAELAAEHGVPVPSSTAFAPRVPSSASGSD